MRRRVVDGADRREDGEFALANVYLGPGVLWGLLTLLTQGQVGSN